MSSDRQPILVIGATGQQGGATARQLVRRGHPVRALVRDPTSPAAHTLQGAGAALVRGDLDDPDSVRAALDGTGGVFLALSMMTGPRITDAGVAAEERRGTTVVDLAARAGVRHLVYSSVHGVEAHDAVPFYRSKAAIEARIHAHGLPATVLRPVSFMDNFTTYNRPVLDRGELVLSLPVRPELPMQLISVTDIGAIAAIAFDRPAAFTGRTLGIAADTLTPVGIAEAFGRAAGLPARFARVPIDRVRAVDAQLATMFTYFDEHSAGTYDITELRSHHPD